MPNVFNKQDSGPGTPVAITPANSDLAIPLRGFMIGGAGNVSVRNVEGQDVTITSPAVGVIHPIMCTRINSTGTTATNIVGIV